VGQKGEKLWIFDESGIHLLPFQNNNNSVVGSGEGIHRIRFHETTCCGVDFSRDGNCVACGDFGGQVMVWSLDHPHPISTTRFSSPVRSLCWRKNGPDAISEPIIVGLMDGSLYVWSHTADKKGKFLTALSGNVTCLQWNKMDPNFLAASSTEGTLAILKWEEEKHTLQTHWSIKAHAPSTGPQNINFGSLHKFAEVWSLCWSPDCKFIATGSEDQKIRIWDTNNGAFVCELTGHTSAVTCVDWKITSQGSILATSGDDRTVRLWKTEPWEIYHVFDTTEIDDWHTVTYLALEGSDRIACATQNGWLFVWNLSTKLKLFSKRLHLGSIEGLRWHDTNNCIVTCASDCVINVIDAAIS